MKIIKKYRLLWRLRRDNYKLRYDNNRLINENYKFRQEVVPKDKYDSLERDFDYHRESRNTDYETIEYLQKELNEFYELKEKHTNLLSSLKVLGIKID